MFQAAKVGQKTTTRGERGRLSYAVSWNFRQKYRPLRGIPGFYASLNQKITQFRLSPFSRPPSPPQMNVICNASHPKAFAAGIAGYGGKVAIERRPYRRIKNGRTVFGAENDMDKNTGERLRHAQEHNSGLQP